ncbi:hypothetical protein LEP1GSC115_0491 [Leptospira interrogans serovar Australis str. 200703203]|uniref:Uncharacterized protein n=3 Tax=Leptospira interrogans TaxID=173 RepID=N1UGZ5_LEPIR|nr:hypothetical protein LEP1GSC115_0491 [Leptospira interrogans serovar Australis str. 200703203]
MHFSRFLFCHGKIATLRRMIIPFRPKYLQRAPHLFLVSGFPARPRTRKFLSSEFPYHWSSIYLPFFKQVSPFGMTAFIAHVLSKDPAYNRKISRRISIFPDRKEAQI